MVNLNSLTVPLLKKLAKECNVNLKPGKKADLIEQIQNAGIDEIELENMKNQYLEKKKKKDKKYGKKTYKKKDFQKCVAYPIKISIFFYIIALIVGILTNQALLMTIVLIGFIISHVLSIYLDITGKHVHVITKRGTPEVHGKELMTLTIIFSMICLFLPITFSLLSYPGIIITFPILIMLACLIPFFGGFYYVWEPLVNSYFGKRFLLLIVGFVILGIIIGILYMLGL